MKNILKKTSFLTIVLVLSTVFISDTNAAYISKTESIIIDNMVNNTYRNLLGNGSLCNTKKYNSYMKELQNLSDSLPFSDRGNILVRQIRSGVERKCTPKEILDFIEGMEEGYNIHGNQNKPFKKGTFKKYIGANIEARQSKKYTYFYYKNKLINTIENKVGGDKYLTFPNQPNPEAFNKSKLSLYSAKFLDGSSSLILFTKKKDYGNANYIYNIYTGKWTNLNMHKFSHIERYNGGYIFIGNYYNGTSEIFYVKNDKRYYLYSTADNIVDFEIGYFKENIGKNVLTPNYYGKEISLKLQTNNGFKYGKFLNFPY